MVPAPTPVAKARAANSPGPVQALVIDRQPLFVAALATLLAAPPLSAQVRAESRSDEALEIVRRSNVDIVLCDAKAEPMPGREFAAALIGMDPPVPVILLGESDDRDWLMSAVSSPAAGVFTKDAGVDEFLVGVDAVLAGHRAIGAELLGHLVNQLSERQQRQSAHVSSGQLSRTELEILAMIGHAASIPSIAASRGISHKTVRNHLAKIYRKLQLHGRTEAMLWATRMGLTTSGMD